MPAAHALKAKASKLAREHSRIQQAGILDCQLGHQIQMRAVYRIPGNPLAAVSIQFHDCSGVEHPSP